MKEFHMIKNSGPEQRAESAAYKLRISKAKLRNIISKKRRKKKETKKIQNNIKK